MHVVTPGPCECRRSAAFILAGPVYNNALKNCATRLSPRGPSLALRAIHLVSRLRRVNRLSSSKLSGTANRQRNGSTLCSPTVGKILCRSPVSKRSHVGNLRQTLQGKGEIHKRVETAGVYPLVRPRGVSALPAEVQRKPPRPLGANTLTQFACPDQSVQKWSLPTVRA